MIDKSEIFWWLSNEKSWKAEVKTDADKEKIFNETDQDGSGDVNLEDLRNFFKKWPIRKMRKYTEDQVIYSASKDGSATQLKKDRSFASKLVK